MPLGTAAARVSMGHGMAWEEHGTYLSTAMSFFFSRALIESSNKSMDMVDAVCNRESSEPPRMMTG